MKHDAQILIKFSLKYIFSILTVCFLLISTMQAQERSQKQRVRLSLQYVNTNNNTPTLLAGVKTKIDRSYEPVEHVAVHFYAISNDTSKVALGSVNTNSKGLALLKLSSGEKLSESSILYHFEAAIEDSPEFVATSKELEVYKSHLKLTEKVDDSLNIVEVHFSAPDSSGNKRPIEDINIKLYAKRMFGNQPVGEEFETTDSEGIIRFVLSNDIPPNENGMLTLIAKLDDDATFGTLVFEKEIVLGTPTVVDSSNHKRELWTDRANTPIALLITINSMILVVWGTILYIVFQLVKIKKIGKHSSFE